MQTPTCRQLHIGTPADAHVVFHAVRRGFRPMITRRLDTDERRSIQSGDVFVWEERGPNAESSIGIERWTDSIRWGPSRVRDEFLYYNERGVTPNDSDSPSSTSTLSNSRESYRGNLVKQTYSVFVDTERGRRKWHLIAYFTQDTLSSLHTVNDFPDLASIRVPPGMYKSARCGNRGAGRASVPEQTLPIIRTYPSYQPISYPHQTPVDLLAPLEYLRACPPPRRHPLDERALMSFLHSSTRVQ